jgi:hypothetical protein
MDDDDDKIQICEGAEPVEGTEGAPVLYWPRSLVLKNKLKYCSD